MHTVHRSGGVVRAASRTFGRLRCRSGGFAAVRATSLSFDVLCKVDRSGTVHEDRRRMAGVRRYERLEVWQLADDLKREVYALVRTGAAARDFEFRDQIRNSAASTTKNIAEGFGRFHPGEFAHFMEFAVASVMETRDSLKDGVDRGYFLPEQVVNAQRLADRSIRCATRFIVYLKREAARRRKQKRSR
jgi:four helix bundle protein